MGTLNDKSVADGNQFVLASYYNLLLGSILRKDFSNAVTMSTDITLTDGDYATQRLDCNGANRIVKVPPSGDGNHPFVIFNTTSSGTWTLSVKSNDGATTHQVLSPGEMAVLVPDGNGGYKPVNDYTSITGRPMNAKVATQFDKTSSTTLSDVTGLTATLRAGRTYKFRAVLYTTSDVAAGVKFAIAGTCTATAIRYEARVFNGAALSAQTRAAALATAVGGVTAVTAAMCIIEGIITVNAAGTLTVQFAQNASNAAASSVLTLSNLIVEDVT